MADVKDDEIEAVPVGPIVEGKQVMAYKHGDEHGLGVVRLVKPGEDTNNLGPNEVYLRRGADGIWRGRSKGPPKVTSDDYRRGWDALFGKPPVVGQA